jgi:hypothetical protein
VDLCPILHCNHSLTLSEGVKLHSAVRGQCSLGIDTHAFGSEIADEAQHGRQLRTVHVFARRVAR